MRTSLTEPINMDFPEHEELMQSLRELKKVVREVYNQARDTERAMDTLINKSNLRSMLTLLNEDITVRRMLDIQHEKPSRL